VVGPQLFQSAFDHENENYFATVPYLDFWNAQLLCPKIEDHFKNSTQSLQMCINTENLKEPTVEFDLIQFRNESATEFEELKDNSNIVKVSWNDGVRNFEEYIVGQDEGVL